MLKKILSLTLALTMVFSLSACSKAEDQNSDLDLITCVLDWTPNTNHTGLYVAQKLGYFKEAGLNVSIVQPPEDGATALVASGKAQFGIDFQDSMTPALTGANPLPVTAVAAIIQHNTSGIISLKDKDLTSPKKMEGKNYATWDLPIEKAMLKYLVEKEGGDFSKVNLIPSTVSDVVTALSTDMDAVWIFYAWDGIATEVKGLATNYFTFKDVDSVFDYYTPVLIASNDFLKNSPETAKKFLAAVKKGYEYAIVNPTEAADILLEAAPELDKDIVTASQNWLADQYKAEVTQWGYIDSERWDGFYKWLFDNQLVESKIPSGTGFTNDFLPN